jgi:SAM-dependent methyltransferase
MSNVNDASQSHLNPQSYFTVPLFDLGDISPRYRGIFAPEPERGVEKVGITEQFLEDADVYHARYADSDHFTSLFSKALTVVGIAPQSNLKILDIGTGSGVNTIVPCARLFPNSEIIATDLSPQLLSILAGYLRTAALPVKVACVCTDAMNEFVGHGRFDLVIGASILHHLIDPAKTIESACRALRKGGIAIFAEPFEAGHLMLAALYRQILALKDHLGGLPPPSEKMLRDMVLDWLTRAGRDKSAPHFRHMDDKWLFSASYIREVAMNAGFKEIKFVPIGTSERPFAVQTEGILYLHSNLTKNALPDWAWTMIDAVDETLSAELKDEMLLEAVIVLRL